MNLVVIQGTLSRDPVFRELPSGDCLVNLEVTVRDRSPAESVPVVWIEPTAGWEAMAAGDAVALMGRVRRRFFRTASAGTQSRTEVVADRVVPARQAKRVRALLTKASTSIEGAERS
jgi:single-stranded DNA-binding protein